MYIFFAQRFGRLACLNTRVSPTTFSVEAVDIGADINYGGAKLKQANRFRSVENVQLHQDTVKPG